MMGVLGGGGGGTPDWSWEPAWAHGSTVSQIRSDTNTNTQQRQLQIHPVWAHGSWTSSFDTLQYKYKYKLPVSRIQANTDTSSLGIWLICISDTSKFAAFGNVFLNACRTRIYKFITSRDGRGRVFFTRGKSTDLEKRNLILKLVCFLQLFDLSTPSLRCPNAFEKNSPC